MNFTKYAVRLAASLANLERRYIATEEKLPGLKDALKASQNEYNLMDDEYDRLDRAYGDSGLWEDMLSDLSDDMWEADERLGCVEDDFEDAQDDMSDIEAALKEAMYILKHPY